jgi:hypothetical protein
VGRDKSAALVAELRRAIAAQAAGS